MNNSILLTGITGFVGSHMADYILKNTDATIYAIRRWRSDDRNIKHLYGNYRVIFIEGDLLDRGSLSNALEQSKPDIVFHFAAQSYPMASFKSPIHTLTTNIIGTTNFLDELRIAKERKLCDPVIISISSSEVYGNPSKDEVPIKETNMIRAANPYSISKVGHDLMSQYYHKAFGLKIIITRMFSHEGSRRGKIFALSNFAYQIVNLEKTQASKDGMYEIKVGNLNSIRTYSHIDDAVKAYWLAATKGVVGEIYNIGGNHTCSVGDALDMLLGKSLISKDKFKIVIDPRKIRPTDITLQIPDCSKFKNQTGWGSIKSLSEICDDLLEYWRNQI